MQSDPNVVIVFGSKSDAEELAEKQKAQAIFQEMGVRAVLAFASAHRNPEELTAWLKTLWESGYRHYAAIAGMSAALPGFIAATLREACVYGVPMSSDNFGNLDALLACLQMPPGLPIRTMTSDVIGFNQMALCVCQDIAVYNLEVAAKLAAYNVRTTKPPKFDMTWEQAFPPPPEHKEG